MPRSGEANDNAEARTASRLGEIGIADAADRLVASGASRALFVSPEGDEAAAAGVLVAREVADAGLRVLLLDLTSSGAASLPMLESVTYPGITNLLASEAQFTDAIHADLYSEAHVIPVGTAEQARAMRAAERLPIILDSLGTAYDLVIVECGPVGAEGLRRLISADTMVMISVIEPTDDIARAVAELSDGGIGEPVLVTPAGMPASPGPLPGRSAA